MIKHVIATVSASGNGQDIFSVEQLDAAVSKLLSEGWELRFAFELGTVGDAQRFGYIFQKSEK